MRNKRRRSVSPDPFKRLSRRERQIMTILYELRSATAEQVQERLPDPPGYSAVRSALALLEERGAVVHEREGRRYVYRPARDREEVREGALEHLSQTFFGGSPAKAAVALMQQAEFVGEEEYRELQRLLEEMRDPESRS